MSDRSKIEWTDATFNPWIGCTKVSPGCDIDDMQCVGRVGKKAAGRLLDGREWNGFPTEAAR